MPNFNCLKHFLIVLYIGFAIESYAQTAITYQLNGPTITGVDFYMVGMPFFISNNNPRPLHIQRTIKTACTDNYNDRFFYISSTHDYPKDRHDTPQIFFLVEADMVSKTFTLHHLDTFLIYFLAYQPINNSIIYLQENGSVNQYFLADKYSETIYTLKPDEYLLTENKHMAYNYKENKLFLCYYTIQNTVDSVYNYALIDVKTGIFNKINLTTKKPINLITYNEVGNNYIGIINDTFCSVTNGGKIDK